MLILHGTADKAAKPQGSWQAGSTDKTLKLYGGHFHDPLNDYGKETGRPTSRLGSMRTFPWLEV